MLGEPAFDFTDPSPSEWVRSVGAAPVAPEVSIAPTSAQPVMTSGAAARGAGVALVFAAIGGAAGAMFGGAWGFGAGILLAGAARNAARARKLWGAPDETDQEEAAQSAMMGVVGAAAGGYLAYRAYRRDKE